MTARHFRYLCVLSLFGLAVGLEQSGMAGPEAGTGGKSPPVGAPPVDSKPDGGAPPPCNPDPCVVDQSTLGLAEKKTAAKLLSPADKYMLIVKTSESVQRCQKLCATAGEAQYNPERAKGVCAGPDNAALKAVSFCLTSVAEDIVNPYEVIRNDKLGTPECRYFLLLIAKAQSDETLSTLKTKEGEQKVIEAKVDLVKIGGELSSFEGICTGALGLEQLKKGASRPFVDPTASKAYCELVSRGTVESRLTRMSAEQPQPSEPVNLKPNSLAPVEPSSEKR